MKIMKHATVRCNQPVKYDFETLTEGISVKDSSSFVHNGIDCMMCTNIADGGIVTFKRAGNGAYEVFQKLFVGWTRMWAPCVMEHEGRLIVFVTDTGGKEPWYKYERMKWFEYMPGRGVAALNPVDMGHNFGVIDPEVIRIDGLYRMIYAITDWTWTDKGRYEWGGRLLLREREPVRTLPEHHEYQWHQRIEKRDRGGAHLQSF